MVMSGLSFRRILPQLVAGSRGLHGTPALPISLSERIFGTTEILKHSLVAPHPNAPQPLITNAQEAGKVKITTLKNGVRVATQDFGRNVSAMAVFTDLSPRYETPSTSGSIFMLDKLAFKGSKSRSRVEVIRDLESLTPSFSCTATRETLAWCAEGLRVSSADCLSKLIETSVFPRALIPPGSSADAEMFATEFKKTVDLVKKYKMPELKKDTSLKMEDALHHAAFSGSTLGMPLLIEDHRLSSISHHSVYEFLSQLMTGQNIVVSACDVDHDEVVKIAEDMLGDLPAGESNRKRMPAKYTGGEVRIKTTGEAHASVAFEGFSWDDEEVVAQFVLQTMMGGGGSFSTGGPGKGLFTRLYSNVLNRHHFILSALSLNNLYADTSVFGIEASCDPTMMNELVPVIMDAALSMAKAPSAEELTRAKNQSISNLLMNLESRVVVCEDLGRQLLNCGKYDGPEYFVDRINKITAKDIQRVGEKLLSSKPSVVMMGEIQGAPIYEEIALQASKGVKSIGA